MGDYNPNSNAAADQQLQQPSKGDVSPTAVDPAFQSQFDHLSRPQLQEPSYGRSFNMGAMSQALPHSPMSNHGHFGSEAFHNSMATPQFMHQMHLGYGAIREQPVAQTQYAYPSYTGVPSSSQQMRQMQLPAQYGTSNLYGQPPFGGHQQHTPAGVDPRMMHSAPHNINLPFIPGTGSSFPQHAHRSAEPAPIPSFPRGPPRKPKQSGHALWVGNLPPAARIEDLKDHFSRDATNDIESVFLISKSNCAFVNYRTEGACSEAMTRFHDSRFQGVRLVCRLRRNTGTNTASGASTTVSGQEEAVIDDSGDNTERDKQARRPSQDPESPVIVGGSPIPSPTAERSSAVGVTGHAGQRVRDRYFIVKSLTVQDLESSIRTGIWATQSHNESLFNDAYENADNVYLVFSANKSGEYFGYARMASRIAGPPVNLNAKTVADEPRATGTPRSIETPATNTAPKGRIIDDSARGTIFWEAVRSEEDGASKHETEQEEQSNEATSGSNWGRQFQIAWISTTRLPFYRTRGLRNPWNSQREVKIARDGTELEPSIGRRLVAMFHGPSGPHHQGTAYR